MRTLDRNAEPVSPVQTVKTVLKTGRVIWFFFPSLINNMRRHSWIPTLCHLICWRGISVFHLSKHFAPKSQCHLLWMTCFNVDCWVITKCANEVFKHEHGKWILFFFLQDWTPMTHRWLSHFGACWRIPMVMRGVDLQTFRCFNWLRSVVYWRTYPRCSGLITCRIGHE